MGTIKWLGQADNPATDTINWFGHALKKGTIFETDNKGLLAQASRTPKFFEVQGYEPGPEPKAKATIGAYIPATKGSAPAVPTVFPSVTEISAQRPAPQGGSPIYSEDNERPPDPEGGEGEGEGEGEGTPETAVAAAAKREAAKKPYFPPPPPPKRK